MKIKNLKNILFSLFLILSLFTVSFADSTEGDNTNTPVEGVTIDRGTVSESKLDSGKKSEESNEKNSNSNRKKVKEQQSSLQGLQTRPDGLYYLDANGDPVKNCWKMLNKRKYYFDESGRAVTDKIYTINNTQYYFEENSTLRTRTGIFDYNGNRYYCLGDSGKLAANSIIKINGQRYFFGKNSELKTNKGLFRYNENRYFCTGSSGTLAHNRFVKFNGKKYFFNSKAAVKTGLFRCKLNKKLYYASKNGIITRKARFVRYKGKRYRTTKYGAIYTGKGFKRIGKYYYYFHKNNSISLKKVYLNNKEIYPNRKSGAITRSQILGAKYGPYYYKKYLLLDIGDQKLYLYSNGKIVSKYDVVTGDPYKGMSTPTGRYMINGKARNVRLFGGSYVSYVRYWIPFIGNSYGLHDASWRSRFGGKIYRGNGSHGCVNMRYRDVARLYDNVSIGTKIFIRK